MSLYGPVDKTLTNRFINPDLASGGFTFPGSVISNGEMVVPDRPFPDVGISYGWTGTANNSESVELRGSQEVRRNLAFNPRMAPGGTGVASNNNGAIWTMTKYISLPSPTPDGITTGIKGQVTSGASSRSILSAYNLDGLSNTSGVTRSIGAWVWASSDGYGIGLGAGFQSMSNWTPLPAQTWTWVTSGSSPYLGTAYSSAQVSKLASDALAGADDVVYITGVTVFEGSVPPDTFFDGDTVSVMDTLNNETIIIKAKNAGQYLRVGETIHQTRTDNEFIRATGTGDLLLSGGSWSGPVTIVPDRYNGDPFSGESDYIHIRKDITAWTSWEGGVNASPSIASYQISEEWARDIHWDDYSSRYYESGLDRGVLYLQDGTSVPWIGLREVNIDDYEGADVETYYVDGLEYLSVTGRGESKGTLSAFTSPEEFDRCAGYDTISNGAYITGQSHEEFGLAYRTFAGDALGGPQSGYKIHLLYGMLAVPASLNYQTLSADPNLIDLSWDIKATRVIFGTPPKSTAHVIIDTRYAYSSAVTALEKVLYGADGPARLPSPDEVTTIMEASDS